MIALTAVLLALAAPAQERVCLPISVYKAGSGTHTYEVRIENRRTPCADGREALRVFVATSSSPGGWTCFRGHASDAWAAACSRSDVVVRAYGPKRERDPWRIAAARLDMPVFAPASRPIASLGVRVVSVKPEKLNCGVIREEVTATYRGGPRELVLTEGRPRVCGDVGNLRLAARPLVNGRRARLYELCEPPGCGRADGPQLLIFRRAGVEIGLQTKGIGQADLLAIARSMKAVVT
jgi:hypothetical protein